jgi:hypothetical protein
VAEMSAGDELRMEEEASILSMITYGCSS